MCSLSGGRWELGLLEVPLCLQRSFALVGFPMTEVIGFEDDVLSGQ
jgi:hypothetical protein